MPVTLQAALCGLFFFAGASRDQVGSGFLHLAYGWHVASE
jgi:hypothetical protein